MSFPAEDVAMAQPVPRDDAPMNDPNEDKEDEDEGEGETIEQGKRISDDSSEEEDEDEEEERKIREGFIVDEDEEEEEEEEEKRRRKKRRKHKHRHRKRHDEDDDENLDEDDIFLLEENTGGRIRSRHLTRLRRGRDTASDEEAATSKRKNIVESSDDDLDESNIIGAREIQDIQDIWNDERAGRDEDEDMDMDDFIDDEEDEEEGAGAMAEEEREERRRERRRLEKERRKALRSRPELTGIDANAWDEIHDVFGDGHDYDWALVEDEDELPSYQDLKERTRYVDVFEPSAIKRKFLTEDDDIIRAQDIPERMQTATSTLAGYATMVFPEPLSQDECVDAASWLTPKLGGVKERDFFKPDGRYHYLLGQLVEAVTRAIEYLFVQFLEVPYIYAHRRDYISYFNPQDTRAPRVELLNQGDLWHIYILGQKFRSLLARRKTLNNIYTRLGVQDEYYEEHLKPNMDSLDAITDITQWLGLKYKSNKNPTHNYDDEGGETKKHKLPSRISEYEVAKKTIVANLAEGFGIKSHEIVVNFLSSGHNLHFVEDKELPPAIYAEQFVDPDPSHAVSAEELLRQARMIIATELGADPLLRKHARELLKQHALVSCLPTDKGKKSISVWHQYYSFLYLHNKPINEFFQQTTQFLQILKAEADHDITVIINLANDVKQEFQARLTEAFASDSFSEVARAWNDERALVVEEAIDKHLIPVGVKWLREYVREEVEETLAKVCGDTLYERINVAPYQPPGLDPGEQPAVLAVSWGKGDPKKDTIHAVFVDEAGRLREHIEIDDLSKSERKDEFTDMIKRRKPDVIVVAGMSITTTKLSQKIKTTLQFGRENPAEPQWGEEPRNEQALDIPVVYMYDDTARLFCQSDRAAEEYPILDELGRYCVGLARYAQNPLNEFAALGPDIAHILFDDNAQPFVSKDKLLMALERALVDVVNKVGVDINHAANDEYYAALLPYVAGLGPRKAQALIKKILALGGNIVNREQFIKSSILTTRIFMNAAGFLRIAQDPDYKEPKRGISDYSMSPDPLDNTRIHPEDYELARKMATDALELDEEDVHDEHPSAVVSQIMKDEDNVKKLDELNLDEFAVNMFETNNDLKRHTLNVIRAELLNPFGELRPAFVMPDEWDVLTALTGETERSLRVGFIIAVHVLRVGRNVVFVKLPSGMDGAINKAFLTDEPVEEPSEVVRKGMTLPGVIIDIKLDMKNDNFSVELSTRMADIAVGDMHLRSYKPDEYWNYSQAERDRDVNERKKRAVTETSRRIIKHPNFKNFNSSQAEAYLDKQQPGEVIIRPSSKGWYHLAVTWKVADKLYQHIDVIEMNPDPSGQTLGTLSVDGKYEYADLDELIVNHVKAMARRVEELMAHEKFKKDEDELHKFLTSFVAANPTKSIYGFTLNRRKPGHFHLSFLPKKGSTIQTWPVRVAPEAYYLFDAAAAGVSELCDAFKVRYLHESQNIAAAGGPGASGKTPYGAGRMTPARTPGYATPGHMSVRQVPRTPNPYPGVSSSSTSNAATSGSTYGGSTTYGGTNSYGFQTPRPPGQPPASGINPARAAMIQNTGPSSVWGSSGWR